MLLVYNHPMDKDDTVEQWRKATGRLVYEADRQATIAGQQKPAVMLMHGLNGAADAKVIEVLVKPGDDVTPDTHVAKFEAHLKLGKDLRAIFVKGNGTQQNATKAGRIDPMTIHFERVLMRFMMTPIRTAGVIKDVLIKPGDVLKPGAPMFTIDHKFKKTFKTQTLNVDVLNGDEIAYEARQLLRRLKRIGIQPPLFPVHVTVVRGQEQVPTGKQHLWKAHEGELIVFEYCLTPEVKYGYWHMNVRSPRMMQLREELGLTAEHNLHLTFGRTPS